MTLALKAWGQRLSKRTGAKRPKCSRAATQIQASLMSHVGQSGQRWLHRICPLMAQSRHLFLHRACLLSMVKQTCTCAPQMSACDPEQTSVICENLMALLALHVLPSMRRRTSRCYPWACTHLKWRAAGLSKVRRSIHCRRAITAASREFILGGDRCARHLWARPLYPRSASCSPSKS